MLSVLKCIVFSITKLQNYKEVSNLVLVLIYSVVTLHK